MSKFLRTMTALSKKPSDFKRPAQPPAAQEEDTGTVPVVNTVPDSDYAARQPEAGTVPVINTVPETNTVPITELTPTSRPRVRVFRATRVQDGHSLGEHLIYEVLWRQGQGDDQTRTVQIGYDRLAAIASVNWKTAKACLKSLEEKLAIETIAAANSNERTGRTYRIHCFTAIIERRRAAGMQWVEKGRGVRFIECGTVPVINTVPDSPTVPETNTVPEAGTGTILKTGTDTVPATGTPLGSLRNIEEITSSSAVATLQQTAANNGIVLDDDAARKLIRRCRTVRDDLTESEIAHFLQIKINQLRNSKTVENWVGMLIASVPGYFEGEAAQLIRMREQGSRQRQLELAQSEAQQRELDAIFQAQKKVLENPESSEEDKALARKILGV
jgi:hypothetical protein